MWTVRYPLVRGCQVIRRVGSYFRSVHAGSRIIHDASAAIGAAGVAVALLAAHTPAASPLEIDGRRAATGVFLAPGTDPDNADLAGSLMLAELVGIAGELDARDLARLGSRSGNPLTIPDHGARAGTLVLARGATVARRPIVALDDGRLAIVDPTDPARGAPIRLDMLARLGIDTTRLSPTDRVPLREALAGDRWIGPTRPSPIQLRGVTHRVRLGRAVAPLTKTLDPPEIRVRLPRDHDPDDPTGVLVWVSDTASGALPAQLERPCDRLGLVAIGVDHAGHDAPRVDRIQRVLDALASVRTIARIDPDRVYIAGFSGGAAIASMAQLALPELFRGALAISGLASHHDAPTGEPGLAWDADLTEPTPGARDLLGARRIGALAGSVDRALPEMRARIRLLRADGIACRLEVIGGLAHAIPSGGACGRMLAWIDKRARDDTRGRAERARGLLERVERMYAPDPASDPRGRRVLVEVTAIAPWSEPAWRAAEMLGFRRE